MLGFLTEALLAAGNTVAAHVAVGGKLPRECVILAADEAGVVLRWATLSETYLFPWGRIEAIVLKA